MKSDYGGRNFETTTHDLPSTESQRFAKWVRFASSCVKEKKKFLNFQPTDGAPVVR